jgi:hypothetical protein
MIPALRDGGSRRVKADILRLNSTAQAGGKFGEL